jgi:hypothetical protein
MARYNKKTHRTRIIELLARLREGNDVQARDIKLVLTDKQHQLMRVAWKEQIELRAIQKPVEVVEYEELLQNALMRYGQYERYSARKASQSNIIVDRQKRTKELGRKAEGLFERALERLDEIISADQSLQIWFDRPLDFSAESNISLDPIGMPRVITSKSLDNELLGQAASRFGAIKDKRQVKMDALEDALAGMDRSAMTTEQKRIEREKEAGDNVKLKFLLSKLNKRMR